MDKNHDIALAWEVLLLEPYSHKARTVERGKADNLNSPAVLRFLVTKKSVREHLKLLLDKKRARMQKERKDSGVEVEETELDQALEEINEKWEATEEQDILLLNNKKKAEEDRAMGEGPKEGVRKAEWNDETERRRWGFVRAEEEKVKKENSDWLPERSEFWNRDGW